MSGTLCAASCIAAVNIPLSASISLSNPSGSFNVTGASGNLYSALGVVLTSQDSGGTGSYTDTVTVVYDGGTGSVGKALSGDGVHNTVTWSGLTVGQSVLFHVTLHVDDGNTAVNARYPASGSISITRTS